MKLRKLHRAKLKELVSETFVLNGVTKRRKKDLSLLGKVGLAHVLTSNMVQAMRRKKQDADNYPAPTVYKNS